MPLLPESSTAASAVAGTITVLFFASARENTGTSRIELALSSATSDPSIQKYDTDWLRTTLVERYPSLFNLLLENSDSVTLALNEEYVPAGAVWPLHAGDTVALIPPISGG